MKEEKEEKRKRLERNNKAHQTTFIKLGPIYETVTQLLKKFPAFVEPEGSLPRSQKPTT
jgi:hypothetical protein